MSKEIPQYCILVNGKETEVLTGATKKVAAEFYRKYHPGEKFYKRTGNAFTGFKYTEVEV